MDECSGLVGILTELLQRQKHKGVRRLALRQCLGL